MPEFSYHAVDRSGQAMHGVMSADDEWKLEEKLQDIGYWLIEAKVQSKRKKNSRARVSRRELIDFFNGMSALLAAGVTAADALKAMVEETTNESFKHILEDIELNVQSGSSIYDSMSKYSHVFSEQVCNLVHAGEYSGNLSITFTDLSHHLEWLDRLIADIKQATIYPAMVLLAVAGLITLLLTFVVPKFTAIFASAGLALPALTQAVVTLGDYWWLVLITTICIAVSVRITAIYYKPMQLFIDKLKMDIPIFGPVNRMLVMSRFVHNLSLMVKSGVPIIEALHLCRGLVANLVMENAVRDAEIAVNEGRKISDALRAHPIVSPLVLRMMVVGEETGNLDEALKHVSERFDQEIPRRIKRAFGVLEPTIILFIVAIVGLVAGAVFMPMFSLMSGLGQ